MLGSGKGLGSGKRSRIGLVHFHNHPDINLTYDREARPRPPRQPWDVSTPSRKHADTAMLEFVLADGAVEDSELYSAALQLQEQGDERALDLLRKAKGHCPAQQLLAMRLLDRGAIDEATPVLDKAIVCSEKGDLHLLQFYRYI